MKLALSSEAAPGLSLAELLQTCEQRGLEAVELVAGHAHGVAPGLAPAPLAERLAEIHASPVRVAGLHLPPEGLRDAPAAARLSAALDVPVVASVEAGEVEELAALFAAHGGRLLLLHGTDAAEVDALRDRVEAAGGGALGLAWDVDPYRDEPAQLSAVLESAENRLEYIRFRGGGPETAQQTGLGVGVLMARLTLSGYFGPLAVRPSTPEYHYAWRAWLGRAGGWGCGSKSSDASLVSLSGH